MSGIAATAVLPKAAPTAPKGPATARPNPAGIVIPTTLIGMDEPAYGLAELIQMHPVNGKGWHRYQVIKVIRNDRVLEYRRDMGKATRFAAPEFRVLGGVADPITGRLESCHTVGELVDIADAQREGFFAPPETMARPAGNLVGGFHDERDRRRKVAKRQSSFGRQFKLQRGS